MPTGTSSALRKFVLTLGAAEALTILVFVVIMLQPTDPIGRAIGQGMAQRAGFTLVVFILPGLWLGVLNRWLPAAVLMLLIAPPLTFILWRLA